MRKTNAAVLAIYLSTPNRKGAPGAKKYRKTKELPAMILLCAFASLRLGVKPSSIVPLNKFAMFRPYWLVLLLAVAIGCTTKPKLAQLSGKVTFKGQPVPAGFISFTPDIGHGEVRLLNIKEGVFDSAEQTPPGIPPGHYTLRINGFDGKRIPNFFQGKQIFNEWTDVDLTVPEGASTKDFDVPDHLGQNVKIHATADY
jgi:hypothetical protein